MRILLRGGIWLSIVLWVGGLLFFPVIAATAFSGTLPVVQAGAVVRQCLLTLHVEGLVAGVLLLVLLAAAARVRAFGRSVVGPVCCTLVMLGLTAFSQFRVIPQMERDRVAVGGDVRQAPNDPHAQEFDRLHVASERLEAGVLAAGLLMIVLLAREGRPGYAGQA